MLDVPSEPVPRWFSCDKDGHLGVFDAEHIVPEIVVDLPEDDLNLTFEISRLLRIENRPVRYVHAQVRGGELEMIASALDMRRYAELVQTVTKDVILARFPSPQRGRAASFMPGIRTFGTGKAEELSSLERAHAEGVCGGCTIDRADDDIALERLQGLGLFVYQCDEQLETLHRWPIPSTLLTAAQLGSLTKKCLRFDGQFTASEEFPMSAFRRPSRT